MRKYLLQLKVPFSIAPGPIHKKQLRYFDLTQPRDTVTSWRHSMTHPNLVSVSQLVDVLERWLFFVSMELRVAEFEYVVSFAFALWRHVMTSCYDVKNRRYSISARRSAREMIFFVSIVYPACKVQNCYRFCVCMISWRHDVTSWCHKTHFPYISL